ncbi:MAG TPA: MarR family transcriptional regulator [Ktedonobacteraceae bacterium]|nr:MarR family transcriptional regulator [Ktedonobacteraceae bacterium]
MDYMDLLSAKEEKFRQRAQSLPGNDPLSLDIYIFLVRISQHLSTIFQSHLQDFGLSEARLAILALLSDAPDQQMPPFELADALRLSRTAVTNLLDGLEKARLITRSASPEDRRMVLASLTQEGKSLLDQVIPSYIQLVESTMQQVAWSEEQRQQFLQALQQLSLTFFKTP